MMISFFSYISFFLVEHGTKMTEEKKKNQQKNDTEEGKVRQVERGRCIQAPVEDCFQPRGDPKRGRRTDIYSPLAKIRVAVEGLKRLSEKFGSGNIEMFRGRESEKLLARVNEIGGM